MTNRRIDVKNWKATCCLTPSRVRGTTTHAKRKRQKRYAFLQDKSLGNSCKWKSIPLHWLTPAKFRGRFTEIVDATTPEKFSKPMNAEIVNCTMQAYLAQRPRNISHICAISNFLSLDTWKFGISDVGDDSDLCSQNACKQDTYIRMHEVKNEC